MLIKLTTFIKLWIIIGIGICCSACETLQQWGGIRPPALSVQKVSIANASLKEMDLIMDIQVENHYPLGIRLPAFDYAFLINDHMFLKGENAIDQAIPASGNTLVQVPLRIHFIDLYQSISALVNEDQASYQLSGNLHFDVPILGQLKIPFDKKGQFPLLKMPKISVKGLHVKSLNFVTAKLALDIEMDNPNAFLMLLKNFSYTFSVDGLQWADGSIQKDITFEKQGKSNISIPIALNFFDMGQSLFNLIQKKSQFPYEFDTHIQLKTELPFLENIDIPVRKSGNIQLFR
ncbi:MAG: LEA type 2 family protein [Candidatus Magnetomorum sp.]|nr:LEA type 2 family protein [Candidatus Magnetomorum sp.]